MSRRSRVRLTEPTICPHCLADQGSTRDLSEHLRFTCPILRPLDDGPRWRIVSGPSPANSGGWCSWRAVKGAQIVNLTMRVELTPEDRDFDAAMSFAVEQARSKGTL